MGDEQRVSRLIVVSGTLLAVVAVLGVLLLVVSPAAFVSLAPGWLGTDGSASWAVAGAGAAAAAVLAVPRGRSQGLRAATITVLLIISGLSAVHALRNTTDDAPAAPENTCVAYSGGRQTCAGG